MSTPRIHVAFVVGSLRMGGAERMMINTANALSGKCDVSFIALTGGADLRHALKEQVKLFSFEKRKSLQAFPALCRLVKKEKPDVIVGTQIHVSLLTVLLKLVCGVSAKIVLREATSPGSHFEIETGIRWNLVKIAVRFLYPRADAIVAICEAVKSDLVAHRFARQEQVMVIYNPVLHDQFRSDMQVQVDHDFFRSGLPVMISVGRLARAKNFPLLLKAFRRVLEKQDARLIVIGDGPEKEKLEMLARESGISDRMDFTGMLNNPYPYLAKSSVYVLTSLYEGLPNALIEAMACGTQLVSVDCPGGSREILENGNVGKLVPMNDPEALANGIIDVLAHPVAFSVMQTSAMRFEASKIADAYLELFKRLSGK